MTFALNWLFRIPLSTVLGLAVCGCAAVAPIEVDVQSKAETVRCGDSVVVSREGMQLRYQGELTEAGLKAIKRLSEGRDVSTLRVTSNGGEINVGMDFGEWVFDRGLSLIVDDYCLSSCANYIFPAAWHKTIAPGAWVAWHGSARQKDLPDQLARLVDDQVKALALAGEQSGHERERRQRAVTQYLTDAIARQDAYFERIGVSEYITRVGSERFGMDGFYYLSPRDMARFGILNVSAPENYAQSQRVTIGSDPGIPIQRLSLDGYREVADR